MNLKNFGKSILNIGSLVTGYGPIFAALIPGDKDDKAIAKVSDTIDSVAGIVQQTEIFGAALGLKGEDKLTAAAPAAAQVFLRSALMAGKSPKDPAMFLAGVKDVISGIVKMWKSTE